MSKPGFASSRLGEADATLLAAAGLDRIGQGDVGHVPSRPAPGARQGAIGVEIRAGRSQARALVAKIDDESTHHASPRSAACSPRWAASCRSPVAALAAFDGDGDPAARRDTDPDGANRRAARPIRAGDEAARRSWPASC
jgi:hydroxymethylbilane synthase